MPNINMQYKPSGNTPAERLAQLENFVFTLTERLTYCLAHLDSENVSEGILTDSSGESYEKEIKDISSKLSALKSSLAEIALSGSYDDLKGKPIHYDTVAGWNAQRNLIGEKSHIYIYTDYAAEQKDGETVCIPNIKIGDGEAFLIDSPFITRSAELLLMLHAEDAAIHVTAADRSRWNDKVRCYIDGADSQNLIFTTD